jgi:hypothetical protein
MLSCLLLSEPVNLCPVNPTSSYCFPLSTTFGHILIPLRFLSREIVRAAHYFFEMCHKNFLRKLVRRQLCVFSRPSYTLWRPFRFLFVTRFKGRKALLHC